MGTIISRIDVEQFYQRWRSEPAFKPALLKMNTATHRKLLSFSHRQLDFDIYTLDVQLDNNMEDGTVLLVENVL